MKLNPALLATIQESDVLPGNIYPAQGGRKSPGTEYWLVIAVTKNGAVCVGFDLYGEACSATTYLKHAMRSRPVLGRADLSKMTLEIES